MEKVKEVFVKMAKMNKTEDKLQNVLNSLQAPESAGKLRSVNGSNILLCGFKARKENKVLTLCSRKTLTVKSPFLHTPGKRSQKLRSPCGLGQC